MNYISIEVWILNDGSFFNNVTLLKSHIQGMSYFLVMLHFHFCHIFRLSHLQNKSHFLWFVTILRFVTLQKSHTFIVCHSFKAVTLTFLLRRKERIKEKNVLKLKIRMTFLHFLMGTTKLFQVFENYQLHIHMWSPFSI